MRLLSFDKLTRYRSDKGSALLVTLLVMALTLAMGAGLLTVGSADLEISDNFRSRASAYYAADGGIEQTLADLTTSTAWIAQMVDPTDWSLRVPFPTTVTIDSMVVTLRQDADGDPIVDFYPLGGTKTLGTGTFTRTIQLPPTIDSSGANPVISFAVRSRGGGGTGAQSTQVVRADVELTVDPYNVWDNAVFGGSGHSGSLINGKVALRGSLHVVGNPAFPAVVSFGGSADIRNNYADAEDHFGVVDAAKLPTLATVPVNGINVASLNATVRVQHGTIALAGGSDIGTPNDDANSVKETVDAIRSDGSVGPVDAVYADSWGPYDANGANFPTLNDPYYDAVNGVAYAHHRDYLDARSLTVGVTEISREIPDFSFSDAMGNSISWDRSEALLNIAGIVRVGGHIRLGTAHGNPERRGFYYAGTGTIYSTNDVEVDGWMVPDGNYIQHGNLGIIAAHDVLIDRSAHINVMAAIYAQDQIRVTKQTNIAGALVANYFDMGTNVPAVFQVPLLASNLPPGMPGPEPVAIVKGGNIANWYQEKSR